MNKSITPTACPPSMNQTIFTQDCSSSVETFTTSMSVSFPGTCSTLLSCSDNSPSFTPPGTPPPSRYDSDLFSGTKLKSPSPSNTKLPDYSAKLPSISSSPKASKISDIEDPELRKLFEENERNLLASLDKSFQEVKDSMNNIFAEERPKFGDK